MVTLLNLRDQNRAVKGHCLKGDQGRRTSGKRSEKGKLRLATRKDLHRREGGVEAPSRRAFVMGLQGNQEGYRGCRKKLRCWPSTLGFQGNRGGGKDCPISRQIPRIDKGSWSGYERERKQVS